mmetsp:Transcript_55123/g.176648  ORF Transcript_55123/g.176648 Transcript_55123/m.176648 type:complete len:351 (+) Transcript_55123:1066-2118(+)
MKIIVLLPKVRIYLADPGVDIVVVRLHLPMHLVVDLSVPLCNHLEVTCLRGTLLKLRRHCRMGVVHRPLNVVGVRVHLVVERLDLRADLVQCFVHFAPATINLEAQCRGHVAHCLYRGVDVVVHVVPCSYVSLCVQLRLSLLTRLCNVLGELVAALVSLLQALGHVLHPSIVRLQSLLHVAHVKPHGGDFGGHCRLHALPGRDDGVRRVYTCAHLVEVHVHGIHCRGEVLHVTLASQHDALHVRGVVLGAVEHVLQLTKIVFHGIQVMRVAGHARGGRPVSTARLGSEEGDLLLYVLRENLQLACDLRLEVAHPIRHLLEELRVACLARQPYFACAVLWVAATTAACGQL